MADTMSVMAAFDASGIEIASETAGLAETFAEAPSLRGMSAEDVVDAFMSKYGEGATLTVQLAAEFALSLGQAQSSTTPTASAPPPKHQLLAFDNKYTTPLTLDGDALGGLDLAIDDFAAQAGEQATPASHSRKAAVARMQATFAEGSPTFSPSLMASGGGASASAAPGDSDGAFLSRENKRTLEMSFPPGAGAGVVIDRKQQKDAPRVEILGDQGTEYRYMQDRAADKSQALRNRIKAVGSEILAQNELTAHEGDGDGEDDDMLPFTQDAVVVTGRICCERGLEKLSADTIILEAASGERAKLDVKGVAEYTLFPGQIVAVEGVIVADRGEKLIKASNLWGGVDATVGDAGNAGSPSKASALSLGAKEGTDDMVEAGAEHDKGGTLRAMVACGPFTTKDSLANLPLEELLKAAADEQPNVLILCGPFVDSNQQAIKEGRLRNSSFIEVFNGILDNLREFATKRCPATTVVLVPSLRDVHHDFVYPQPAFGGVDVAAPIGGGADPLVFAPNPATLRCKGVTVGVSTSEILKNLSGACVTNIASAGDAGQRMANLAKHLLGQRSHMPMFPAAKNFPLDLSRVESANMVATPDVLLLPSDLKFMARPLKTAEGKDGTMVINPCRLCRGSSAGTYVTFTASSNEVNVDITRI